MLENCISVGAVYTYTVMSLLKHSSHDYHTRHPKCKYVVKFSNEKFGQRSLSFMGVKL